jgi:hypothetical protein
MRILIRKEADYKKTTLVVRLLYSKEIGDKEPYYSTKISIFSFFGAGLAALHKSSKI